MAKRVFFSFHYQDVIDFRANVVRSHWLTKPNRKEAGFFDASIWESAKKTSPLALKRLINGALTNTSTTVVLIGSETYSRRWVRYEIIKSIEVGNTIVGIHINKVRCKNRRTKPLGPNPFLYLGCSYSEDGRTITFYEKDTIYGQWRDYEDVRTYNLETLAPLNKRGKSFNLDQLIKTYDWIEDGGYNNFSDWVNH